MEFKPMTVFKTFITWLLTFAKFCSSYFLSSFVTHFAKMLSCKFSPSCSRQTVFYWQQKRIVVTRFEFDEMFKLKLFVAMWQVVTKHEKIVCFLLFPVQSHFFARCLGSRGNISILASKDIMKLCYTHGRFFNKRCKDDKKELSDFGAHHSQPTAD